MVISVFLIAFGKKSYLTDVLLRNDRSQDEFMFPLVSFRNMSANIGICSLCCLYQ